MTDEPRRRVAVSQLESLWEFLNTHKSLVTGYSRNVQAREATRRTWETVAANLNAHGDGAIKDWRGWSKYWSDYKCKLKSRVAAVRSSHRRTGGGPSSAKELTEIEKKILGLLGEDFGLGIAGARVDPFEATQPSTSQNYGSASILESYCTGSAFVATPENSPLPRPSPPSPRQSLRHSQRYSPRNTPRHSPRHSPRISPRHSPRHLQRYSPRNSPRHSPRHLQRYSPRHSPRHSQRYSPRFSPITERIWSSTPTLRQRNLWVQQEDSATPDSLPVHATSGLTPRTSRPVPRSVPRPALPVQQAPRPAPPVQQAPRPAPPVQQAPRPTLPTRRHGASPRVLRRNPQTPELRRNPRGGVQRRRLGHRDPLATQEAARRTLMRHSEQNAEAIQAVLPAISNIAAALTQIASVVTQRASSDTQTALAIAEIRDILRERLPMPPRRPDH